MERKHIEKVIKKERSLLPSIEPLSIPGSYIKKFLSIMHCVGGIHKLFFQFHIGKDSLWFSQLSQLYVLDLFNSQKENKLV
jgi:hypothetical protein